MLKSQKGSQLWKTYDTEMDVNRTWETITENIKICAKEKHKSWFNKGCSKLLDQRKQAKLQWL
jgi:hypothetical protein